MKHIVSIVSIALLLTLTSTTAQAQDLYQIRQTLAHTFSVNKIEINSGWDVRLIQSPKKSPTLLMITTPCAEFFEEGSEPSLMEVKYYKRGGGWYELKPNQWMPRTTLVEIYTSEPIDRIELHKGARLTIQRFDFDSTELDITIDSGATLIIDTLDNRGTTCIDVHNGTLDLRRIRGRELNILTYGTCNVTEGDVQTTIPHTKEPGKEWKFRSIFLYLGMDLSMPLWNGSSHYGSPYNTDIAFSTHIKLTSNDMEIHRRLAWNFGLDVSANILQLDNVVKTESSRLVLDPSHGATPPRQSLYYWTVGIPFTLKYNLGNWGSSYLGTPIRTFYATLTPTLNFKPRLVTQSLDEDNSWSIERERVDILNRFNVRASIGFDCTIGGLHRVELFIDLLSTFNAGAEAPKTRMMGLSYIF